MDGAAMTDDRDLPVLSDEVQIRRVRVDRVVDEPPPTRFEHGVMIVPVTEEVLVRQLLLREELHITVRDEAQQG